MFGEQQTTPKLISQNSKHLLFLLILRVGWVVYLVWVGSADFCSILAVWLGGGSRMAILKCLVVGRLVVFTTTKFFSKGSGSNISGFAGQKAKLSLLCRYIYNKGENSFYVFFIDKVQNKIIMSITFFVIQVF